MIRAILSLTLALLLESIAWAQCSGLQLVSNKGEVCAPDIVRYQVLNAPAGATYVWNVGTGTITGADTLFAFYSSPDTIDATVTVTLANGATCVLTEPALVIIRQKPNPEFLASKDVLCNGPGWVTFTDITPNSASRNWVIDGSNYNQTGDTVAHYFVTTGLKTVSLVVEDSFGCQGVRQFFDTIKVYKDLDFRISADARSGCAPKTINFGLSSDPGSNFTKSYRWTFEGTTPSQDTNRIPAPRYYGSSGSYGVHLEVSLSNGCVYRAGDSSFIELGDTVSLRINRGSNRICDNEPFDITVVNASLPGELTWSFRGLPVSIDSISEKVRRLTTTSTGRLAIRVDHEHNGCVSTKEVAKFVDAQAVLAAFSSVDNYHCMIPHTVHLDNQSDTLDANSLTYRWNIYDNGTLIDSSTSEHDSFTFNTMPGLYDVELIVIGDNGCTDTMRKNGFIYQDSLKLKFRPIPPIGCVGQPIYFENTTKPSSYLSADTFVWTFFDSDDSTVLDTSHEINPYHTYWDTGYYDVLLEGANGIGCRDSLYVPDVVQIVDPQLDFLLLDSTVCLGDSFEMVALSTPSNIQFNHTWIFRHLETGNIRTVFGANPKAAPPWPGPYRLIYRFDIEGGCVRSDSVNAFVNGASGTIQVGDVQDCAPFELEPQVALSYNYYHDTGDSTIQYAWSMDPGIGVLAQDTNTANPWFRLDSNGLYDLHVLMVNSTLCSTSLVLDSLQAGLVAEFTVDDPIVCLGDTIWMTKTRDNLNSSFSWDVVGASSYTLLDTGSNRYGLVIPDSGYFTVELRENKDDRCYDTARAEIRIIQVVADFAATDTFLQCAPVYVQFESYSINADSLFWDFGDGTKNVTTSASAGTIYQKNTGWTDGYDIALIAKHIEGCVDSALKLDYVVVAGPRPEFDMFNYVGCEPLEVSFVNRSQDAVRFFMNYNDGSDLDSTSGNSHVYYNQTGMLVQRVFPSLFVYDSLGCGAVYTPPEPVTIYKKPTALMDVTEDTTACLPIKLVFEDTSAFRVSSTWYLNGDSLARGPKDSVWITEPGATVLTLITTNTRTCKDTTQYQTFASGLPELDIEVLDTLCLFKNVQFDGIIALDSTVDTAGMRVVWNLGEPGNPMNIREGEEDPFMVYQQDGSKDVQLKSILANGCADSVTIRVYVRGPNEIDTPQIRVVSFSSNYQLDIWHEAAEDPRFMAYNYGRNDGYSWQNTDWADTLVLDQWAQVPDSALCYDLSLLDSCDLQGRLSTRHCFIHLTVSSTVPYQNDLVWTPYIGWNGVRRYHIFRQVEGEDDFTLLATVPGDQLTYTDPQLCDLDYTYYVQAEHPDRAYISNSFSVLQRPLYPPIPYNSSIRYVTVSDENEISVFWPPSTHSEWDHYVLRKYQTDESELLETIELTDTFYIDRDVQTSVFSYVYTVHEVDRCQLTNEPDREGKSILLSGYYDNSEPASQLLWTPYRKWLNGVQQYHMELVDLPFVKPLGSVSPAVLNYTDKEHHPEVLGPYCYRVYGINEELDRSYSNIVCLAGEPIVHIPNAFSPNNDGHNEDFHPVTTFVEEHSVLGVDQYLFQIYNRWGELLFETDELTGAWDGTFMEEDCQQDVYVYRIELQGVNGKFYSYHGTVTLLR